MRTQPPPATAAQQRACLHAIPSSSRPLPARQQHHHQHQHPRLTPPQLQQQRWRALVCAAAPPSSSSSSSVPPPPDLGSLNRAGLSNALLMMNLLSPRQDRRAPGGGGGAADADADARGADEPLPLAVPDFVEALEVLVRSPRGNAPNPAQLAAVFDELLQQQLLPAFSDAQLAATLKNLGVTCTAALPRPLLAALVAELRGRLADVREPRVLANTAWGLTRLAPLGDDAAAAALGVDAAWVGAYHDGCCAVLASIAGGAAPPQPGQVLANLLLLPAALQAALPAPLQAALEAALLAGGPGRLCGMAVAQLLTCYVRLELQPSPPLASLLLGHVEEELLLYDHDELTQAAVGIWALGLAARPALLADLGRRAAMLQAGGQADSDDIELLAEVMHRLSGGGGATAAVAATAQEQQQAAPV